MGFIHAEATAVKVSLGLLGQDGKVTESNVSRQSYSDNPLLQWSENDKA